MAVVSLVEFTADLVARSSSLVWKLYDLESFYLWLIKIYRFRIFIIIFIYVFSVCIRFWSKRSKKFVPYDGGCTSCTCERAKIFSETNRFSLKIQTYSQRSLIQTRRDQKMFKLSEVRISIAVHWTSLVSTTEKYYFYSYIQQLTFMFYIHPKLPYYEPIPCLLR